MGSKKIGIFKHNLAPFSKQCKSTQKAWKKLAPEIMSFIKSCFSKSLVDKIQNFHENSQQKHLFNILKKATINFPSPKKSPYHYQQQKKKKKKKKSTCVDTTA